MKPIICVLGPSGVGKSFYVELLRKKLNLSRPKTITTRKPRRDDINHIYVGKEEFLCMIEKNELLEWDEYNENYYGIMMDEFRNLLDEKESDGVIMDITPEGFCQVKEFCKNTVAIALIPDYISWLKNRLIERGVVETKEVEKRMEISGEELKGICHAADHIVICKNDPKTTENTLKEISDIIASLKDDNL